MARSVRAEHGRSQGMREALSTFDPPEWIGWELKTRKAHEK